jgi:FtsP/CotA-like multicopper oxidase with cupredoxin domain
MRVRAAVVSAVLVAGGLAGVPAATMTAFTGQPRQDLPAAEAATPSSPTDSTTVPHYFGPWPNWANSPLTRPNATVTIAGDGTGATAQATVDPLTGGITSIDVTDPGRGYTDGNVTVTIGGGDGDPAHAASASATVTASGVVNAITVGSGGGGYTDFDVAIAGDGTGASAVAAGGVDAVILSDGGTGYTAPTVEFDLPDLPDGRTAKAHVAPADIDASGVITAVTIDDPGSGYLHAPGVAIHNGTVFDPVPLEPNALGDPGVYAVATTTLALTLVQVENVGSGYSTAPTVTISDVTGTGAGATATASTTLGAVSSITVDQPGSGYLKVGIKKFQDDLPMACDPSKPVSAGGCSTDLDARYLPVAVGQSKTYNGVAADEIVIGLVQYRRQFNADLPPTLVRGYVQLETPANASWSQHIPLSNEMLDGSSQPTGYYGVTTPQFLGPFIQATKNRPVRVIFRNLLPTGEGGDLFLPTDSSMMGSGMGPMTMTPPVDDGTVLDEVRNPECTQSPKPLSCFKDNRATLHLHGGITPWISDGTPHQWITPANEMTDWPQGVSVSNVPDMADAGCDSATDGCQTFYYTNQQSARLMFYHDHAWGTTRLNVYAGEAAGYSITDSTEQSLISSGTIPNAASTLPLIVQDRTFVPDADQLAEQDPTWDTARWGTKGSFWYHHVYMPAQNPGDPSGASAFGRWMYGPWFYPPASDTKYGPIDNPYFDPNCQLDEPSTWQYQTDPFCEPRLIPGTPNISAGMEQFNDTPLVNGVAYPTVTLEPKSYRLRLLNAANDRFFNFQWYVADPNQGDGTTEVKLNPAELAAAQTDPNVVPSPVQNASTRGPDWIQIANEAGFLPAPTVIDGQQPTTWITDPARFDVGNVDKHSLLLAPAERADAIVDFSAFAGKTLILYNDAPAAFPARVPGYDYYTGGPDLWPTGAPTTLPGYGPNTRTIMQVTIAASTPASAFNLTKLQNAFKHNAAGTGVFESSQHPIIVGQSVYNSAYGSSFVASGDCGTNPTLQRCDGIVRINDTGSFTFNTLRQPASRQSMALQPKAIHDEMNATTFDEFGRMQANLGIEASPPTPGANNVTLYPFVNPPTELIDGTGLPSADTKVTPIANLADGTQIWRITHNGVDTHPIHFHLFDVQVLNRVSWDNNVVTTEPNELGWKDTVRVSPLQDTVVALRPIIPKVPFEVPNSVRVLSPMELVGSTAMFHNVNGQGQPTQPIVNQLVNFGWEYVYHCHILSHEEMDMMRPVSLALPPTKANAVTTAFTGSGASRRIVVNWTDNSITETAFVVQRSSDGTTWTNAGTVASPLDVANTHGARSFTDPTAVSTSAYLYRVVAQNTVGYGGDFPSVTAQSVSDTVGVNPPLAPTGLHATPLSPTSVRLDWTDNAVSESSFIIERSTDNATWTQVGTAPALAGTGTVTAVDSGVVTGATYYYRVAAVNVVGRAYSASVQVAMVGPDGAPTGLAAALSAGPSVALTWTDNASNETGFVVERSTDAGATFTQIGSVPAVSGTGPASYTDASVAPGATYTYRVAVVNGVGSLYSGTVSVPVYLAAAPTGLTASVNAVNSVRLQWTDNATNETSYVIERSSNGTTFTQIGTMTPRTTNPVNYVDSSVTLGRTYYYRVAAVNPVGRSYSNVASVLFARPATPTGLTGTAVRSGTGEVFTLNWNDVATNEASYRVQWRIVNATDASATVTLPANSTTYTSPVVTRRTWQVRVAAVNPAGTSYTAWVTVAMAP